MLQCESNKTRRALAVPARPQREVRSAIGAQRVSQVAVGDASPAASPPPPSLNLKRERLAHNHLIFCLRVQSTSLATLLAVSSIVCGVLSSDVLVPLHEPKDDTAAAPTGLPASMAPLTDVLVATYRPIHHHEPSVAWAAPCLYNTSSMKRGEWVGKLGSSELRFVPPAACGQVCERL